MMKKVTDERLKLKNLKNIRVLFSVQSIGIIGILGYDWITKGIDAMTTNPLWYLFIITTIISAYLSMSISVDHESHGKSPKKGLIISSVVIVLVSIVVGILVSFTSNLSSGALVGTVIFMCFLVPILYVYYLRTRKQD